MVNVPWQLRVDILGCNTFTIHIKLFLTHGERRVVPTPQLAVLVSSIHLSGGVDITGCETTTVVTTGPSLG